jgi:hypothetical protein
MSKNGNFQFQHVKKLICDDKLILWSGDRKNNFDFVTIKFKYIKLSFLIVLYFEIF